MANGTITIKTEVLEGILEELETLKKKVAKLLPKTYGSPEWWDKSEQEADKDIKAGKLYTLHDANDLDKPIEKLKVWK